MARILTHIGEPATPPRIALARGPPSWEEDDSGTIVLDEEGFPGDPLVQPEPAYAFDHRVSWASGASAAASFPVA